MKSELNANFLTEVDGGVTTQNAAELITSGVDILVAGSTVFKSENPSKTIRTLKEAGKTSQA